MLLSSIILTTAFLAVNHLYSTFASPMVSKDGVAVGHSFNLTHSLAKRQYAPEDQKCLQADDWVARTCYTLNGDVEWMDWCLGLFVGVYVVGGVCPFGTMCMDTEIENTDPFNTLPNLIIACVPRPNTIYVIQITIFEIQQNGVVVVGPQTGITDPGHTTVSITLQKRIPGATVSAFLEGIDGNYIITPTNSIVGTLDGTNTQTCNYNQTNHNCVPTDRYDLNAGATITFAFGLLFNEDARLYYSIIGTPG